MKLSAHGRRGTAPPSRRALPPRPAAAAERSPRRAGSPSLQRPDPRRAAMAAADEEHEALATAPPEPREEPASPAAAADAALLEAFLSVPTLARGWAFPSPAPGGDGARAALQLSQRDVPSNRARKYLLSFTLSEAALEAGAADPGPPLELRDAAAYAPAPSGRRSLVVRAAPASGGGDNGSGGAMILEVWDRSRLLKELHVPAAMHGAIYNDGWFGSGAAWSPDERLVAYVAEAPPATRTPEWGGGGGEGADGADGGKKEKKAAAGAAPKAWRGVGAYEEDWGELNTGKRPPTLFVLDTEAWTVAAVGGLPAGASCGQPAWAPDASNLVFVAWPHAAGNFPDFPQRLGVVHCFNRPAALWAAAWPQPASRTGAPPAVQLTPPALGSAFSPRFSPNGGALVFLSQRAAVESGAHSATCALHALDWRAAAAALADSKAPPAPREVVGVVRAPAGPEAFPGLYAASLPEQPFVDDDTLLLTSQWRSNAAVVAVSLSEGTVTRASPANGASWSVAAVARGWALAAESSHARPLALFASHTPVGVVGRAAGPAGAAWSWSRLALPDEDAHPPAVVAALAQATATVLQVAPADAAPGGGGAPFEAVLLARADRPGPRPTVLTPHGGPHTAYSAQFFAPLAFLLASGFNVVLVNYRGSTGFGEEALQSLPGRVGAADVADCIAALAAAAATGAVDSSRVAAVGGSHGGFLSAHLAGQQPELFRAAVLRNPVCDLELMARLTDIPDWCYVEAFGSAEGRKRAGARPTRADLDRFAAVSPVAHAGAVTAPVLMLLGSKDRRVPLEDGRRYLEALRARGAGAPETRLLVFPQDSHALDRPQTEVEQWVNVAWWLRRHVLP
jgi:acylaminoacyl-peptidase